MHGRIAARRIKLGRDRLEYYERQLSGQLILLAENLTRLHSMTGDPAYRSLAQSLALVSVALEETPPTSQRGLSLRLGLMDTLRQLKAEVSQVDIGPIDICWDDRSAGPSTLEEIC